MFTLNSPVAYQTITLANGICLSIKRLDQVHPRISGNKWYKLKYNLIDAKQHGYTQLLSFGGAYSNHIAALAYAAHEYGFESIGVIRGAELADKPLNPTLQQAKNLGMHLTFISRADYRRKHTDEFIEALQACYPTAYIIPEGGTNALAVKGCEEILSVQDRQNYDVIVCALGTGGTFSGLVNASGEQQILVGFSALKGDFLTAEVQKWTDKNKQNWQILAEDRFGGYGRFNQSLLSFIADIEHQYDLPLEPIYTAKAFFRLLEMIEQAKFAPNSRILFIHTGGLQGYQKSQ